MYNAVRTVAEKYGFKKVFFTRPMRFDKCGEGFRLVYDAAKEYPFAKTILLFVYPYKPFFVEERIPSYYLASNRAYFALKETAKELSQMGFRAEIAEIPLKLQAVEAGVGVKCRNSLIAFEGFGTRVVLSALAVDKLEPIDHEGKKTEANSCGQCQRCMEACPANAIDETGLCVEKCMRFHMETAMHPDWVREIQRTYIGCEVCQYACTKNTGLMGEAPSEEVREAFSTKKLIAGDTKAARLLTGKNMTSRGKLTAEAIAFAANDDGYWEEIELAERSSEQNLQFEAVRDAIRYAKERKKFHENKKKQNYCDNCRSDGFRHSGSVYCKESEGQGFAAGNCNRLAD